MDPIEVLKDRMAEPLAETERREETVVSIEIKPWKVTQDLRKLWKKITNTVVEDGLTWSDSCTLMDVAYSIQKLQTTFVLVGGEATHKDRADTVVDEILTKLKHDVQSAEVTSLHVFGEDKQVEPAKESWAKTMARSKETDKKQTQVTIDVNPWTVDQDLCKLWKRITQMVVEDGLTWSDSCTLEDVAYSIQKLQTTFVLDGGDDWR